MKDGKLFIKKKAVLLIALVFLFTLTAYGQRRPQKVVIKLASLVPENTDWGRTVNKLAAEWDRVTNGEVELRIYANGTQGNEDEVLRKLNMNTIQAGIFTSLGLNKIAPEILTLSVPFMIRSDAELDEVFRQVKGDFENRINAKNYVSLALVKGGWVKFFSRNPVFVPADLKKQKFACSPSEAEMAQTFRQMGYQIVMVDPNRLLIALNGGTADALFQSPIFTAGAQYFGVAKNMASINIAPFLGGIVMNKQAWESIPPQYRSELMRVTRRVGTELEDSLLKLEADTVRIMKNNGLRENQVNAAQLQEWYNDAERAIPALMGSTFDRVMYNKIQSILRTYRSRQ